MPHSLGWHPNGHRPGPRECTVYEELQDRVLNHLPLCSSASRWHCLVLGITCPHISNQCWDQCHTRPLGRCAHKGYYYWPWWWCGTLWWHPYRRGDRINMWCLQVVNRYVWCLSERLYIELLKVKVNRQRTSPGGQSPVFFNVLAYGSDSGHLGAKNGSRLHSWAQGRTEDLSGME